MRAPDVVAQPRQDVLVRDATSGEPRRMTTYTGTLWFAPLPQIGSTLGLRVVTSAGVDPLDPTESVRVYLPDSLPYVAEADGVVTASGSVLGAVDQTGTDAWLLYPPEAGLIADPRGGARSWVALDLRGHGRLHAASYTVVVTVPVDDVAS